MKAKKERFKEDTIIHDDKPSQYFFYKNEKQQGKQSQIKF